MKCDICLKDVKQVTGNPLSGKWFCTDLCWPLYESAKITKEGKPLKYKGIEKPKKKKKGWTYNNRYFSKVRTPRYGDLATESDDDQ